LLVWFQRSRIFRTSRVPGKRPILRPRVLWGNGRPTSTWRQSLSRPAGREEACLHFKHTSARNGFSSSGVRILSYVFSGYICRQKVLVTTSRERTVSLERDFKSQISNKPLIHFVGSRPPYPWLRPSLDMPQRTSANERFRNGTSRRVDFIIERFLDTNGARTFAFRPYRLFYVHIYIYIHGAYKTRRMSNSFVTIGRSWFRSRVFQPCGKSAETPCT